jgi:hypothetical protein
MYILTCIWEEIDGERVDVRRAFACSALYERRKDADDAGYLFRDAGVTRKQLRSFMVQYAEPIKAVCVSDPALCVHDRVDASAQGQHGSTLCVRCGDCCCNEDARRMRAM